MRLVSAAPKLSVDPLATKRTLQGAASETAWTGTSHQGNIHSAFRLMVKILRTNRSHATGTTAAITRQLPVQQEDI